MALLEQITNQLNNPAPTFDDPEQDSDDVTQAQITYNKDDNETIESGASQLRRQTASFLSDTDTKYAGQKLSRKNLDWFDDKTSESEGDESESETGSELKLESESGTEDSEEEEQQLYTFSSKVKQTAKKHKPENEFRFKDDGDYSKYADSLDKAEDDSSENTEDDQSMEYEDSGDECGKTEKSKDNQEDEVLQTVVTDQSDEIAKGRATIAQLGVWDSLMEGRIKLQKMLVLVNQLPQPDVWKQYVTEGSVREAAEKAQSMLQELLAALLQMQGKLLLNRAAVGDAIDIGDTVYGSDINEAASLKRKHMYTDFDEICAKRHAGFCTYRNDTLHKWHDKTRLFSKKLKSFSAFDIPVLKQIDQILSDRDRLVRRTQIKRSSYHVVGKPENAEKPEPSKLTSGSLDMQPTVVHDPEIFDDDDFYHQLLRDLIEQKAEDASDPTMVSRQWLEIQKLRNKAKRKNVDTRASKGRKLRYNVHNKLVNFMAPMDSSTWSAEAKNDLFASLFKEAAAPVER